MANATVGTAMGAAGSDVTLKHGSMADNIDHLPFVVFWPTRRAFSPQNPSAFA